MIPAGSFYTVSVTGQYGGLASKAGDVQASVNAALVQAGFRVIVDTLTPQNWVPSLYSFPIAGTVTVRTTFDYAQDQDVIYQIGQAIEQGTGTAPTLSVSVRGGPDEADPNAPAPSKSLGDYLKDLADALNQDLKTVLFVGVGLVVVVVVVVGWSPNAPKLAKVSL